MATRKSPPPDAWVGELSPEGLLTIVEASPAMSRARLAQQSIDEIGNATLPRAIDGVVMYASWPAYWEQLKAEFRLLLCTRDRKYAALRRELRAKGKKSQATIVSLIAAAVASRFGVAAGVLVPFCALCLIAVLRLGREAFCASGKLELSAK